MGLELMYKVLVVRGRGSCFERIIFFPFKWVKGCSGKKERKLRVNKNILNKKKKEGKNLLK